MKRALFLVNVFCAVACMGTAVMCINVRAQEMAEQSVDLDNMFTEEKEAGAQVRDISLCNNLWAAAPALAVILLMFFSTREPYVRKKQ